MRKLLPLLLLAVAALGAAQDAAPLDAATVVRQATRRANAGSKNVFVYFHASWCSWCKRLEALFEDPRFKSKFADSYVVASITIREREEKVKLENPGWERVLRRLRQAEEKDVPYYVVLSPKGERLGGSYRGKDKEIPNNAGFPQTDEEIAAFLTLIEKTAKAFTAEDRAALKEYLEKTRPPA